jgi:hypothetical protein
MTNNLATFDDTLTMRHVREYAHPIERVWDAVTMTEHLDVLSGEWTREHALPLIEAVYADRSGDEVWEELPETRSAANSPERHGELVEIYRRHIEETYPR